MKSFTWMENDDDEVANGHYECKLHDRENCPYCTDISFEKPLRWTITKTPVDINRKSLLDEVMEKNLRKFLNE